MAKTMDFDVDDPRYRITPTQQMMCSCLGALTTSTLGKKVIKYTLHKKRLSHSLALTSSTIIYH